MTTESTTESIFDRAADTYVSALKSCVHLQEEMAKKTFDLAKGWGETDNWMKNSQDFVNQAMPKMQQTADESMKLWEENAAKCMDLLGQGFATMQTPTPTDAQERLKKFWEQSLDAMRENSEKVIGLSNDAMKAYADFVKEQSETATAAATAG